LSHPAQVLLRRLSIFSGGFTLGHVDEIWSDESSAVHLAAFEELNLHSLLARQSTEGGARFRLLDTVREYARERLVDAEESDDAHRRLVKWVEQRVATVGRVGLGAIEFEPLEAEVDNVRGAVSWALGRAPVEERFVLCNALYVWWMYRVRRSELEGWLNECFKASTSPTPSRALALLNLGRIQAQAAKHAESTRTLMRAIGEFNVEDPSRCCEAWLCIAENGALQGELESADEALATAGNLLRELDDQALTCRFLLSSVLIQIVAKRYADAVLLAERALALEVIRDWADARAKALGWLGEAQRLVGATEEAIRNLEEASLVARRSENREALEFVAGQLALAYASSGRRQETRHAALMCLQATEHKESDPYSLFRATTAVVLAGRNDGDDPSFDAAEALLARTPLGGSEASTQGSPTLGAADTFTWESEARLAALKEMLSYRLARTDF
jgi:tetratricopeptide (TPR) repeat protein